MARSVSVGLIGLGTIGTGVARMLLERARHQGTDPDGTIALSRIADKDTSDREFEIPSGVRGENADDVLLDDDIDIVVELIGGTGAAREFVLKAIENGKHVVTANKALISAYGDEIFSAAEANGVDVLFEAAVGGSIPILRALRESLQTSRIDSVYGIVNGTTNYILTRMSSEGAPYDELLASAQEQGFAERDPSADVKGWDSQQKLAILLRFAFGAGATPDQILCEGIESVTPLDLDFAREFGYTVKLLAIAKRHDNGIEARVHPAMIPAGSVMAGVKYEYNAVEVIGEEFGTQMFYGKGAGQRPTATVVASDVLDIAQRIQTGASCCRVGNLLAGDGAPPIISADELTMRHYVRLEVEDRAGVLEHIANVFASQGISIESVVQKGRAEGETVPLVIMTHEATEYSARTAVASLEDLSYVRAPVQRIRVEELS